MHDQRLMLTTNHQDPKCYEVTKINEMSPQGIIKLTFKQDEFNEKRDSAELLLCDYFTDSGVIKTEQPTPRPDPMKTSTIKYMILDSNGEFVESTDPPRLHRGDTAYFRAFYSSDNIVPDWRVDLIYCPNKNIGDMSETQINYYNNLLKITVLDEDDIQVKVAKAKSIIGCKFKLSIMDQEGSYYSTIDIEVIDDEA